MEIRKRKFEKNKIRKEQYVMDLYEIWFCGVLCG